ncbi:MAG TPA: lipoate--protein ligase, partial [Clostridiales bacterium]|nr:lipoate--protein ligase [Clostridiales bacterium]
FGKGDIQELEQKIRGLKYNENEVLDALSDIAVEDYLGRISKEEFIQCLFN